MEWRVGNGGSRERREGLEREGESRSMKENEKTSGEHLPSDFWDRLSHEPWLRQLMVHGKLCLHLLNTIILILFLDHKHPKNYIHKK